MTGMEHVVAIRKRRVKPQAVTVRLVEQPAAFPAGLDWLDFGAETGHVTVEVPTADRLGDIDFRPLKGLHVTVEDLAGDAERHRKVAAMVAAIDPAVLVMPCWAGESCTLHILRGDTTETHSL